MKKKKFRLYHIFFIALLLICIIFADDVIFPFTTLFLYAMVTLHYSIEDGLK